MNVLVTGASRGLGRAFAEHLPVTGDLLVGVSRRAPGDLHLQPGVEVRWVETDLARPLAAAQAIEAGTPAVLDAVICNVGIWEQDAFSDRYRFLAEDDDEIVRLVNVNITSTLLLLRRLLPRLLQSGHPRLILVGSTSGLERSGRPEVAFAASKFALNGMADALREGFRTDHLAVTCLQLGTLATDAQPDLRHKPQHLGSTAWRSRWATWFAWLEAVWNCRGTASRARF